MKWVALVPRHRVLPPGRPASALPNGLTLRTSRHKGRMVQLRFAIGRDVAQSLRLSHGDRVLVSLGFGCAYGRVKLEKSDIGHVVNLRTLKALHMEVAIYSNRWGRPDLGPGLVSTLEWWMEGNAIIAKLPKWALPEAFDLEPSR